MLDTNDIQVLREMFTEHEVRFDQKLDRLRDDLSAKIEQECSKVHDDVIDVINMNIILQLNRFDARATKLERLQSRA